MNQLQSKLLEMLTWLSKYLEEHNIRYYVVAGTFLGAVRHEGFIPWDDDVDIAVPRADYQRLLELLKEPVDHYVIESPYGGAPDFIYKHHNDRNCTKKRNARCVHRCLSARRYRRHFRGVVQKLQKDRYL